MNETMSLGEIFSKAAMNTLLGMGTVFAVLILISFIISLFKYIGPKKVEKAASAVKTAEPAPVEEVAEEDETDEYELIAVITAAIAAATGSSTSEFVVKSIKRARNSKWRRA